MMRRAICASLVRFAQIFRLLVGIFDELLQELHGLTLDTVGIEIVFGARYVPAAPIALGGHDHGMRAGVRVVPACLPSQRGT